MTTKIRAAQYVRMSTEHQQYSTENQADVNRAYAEKYSLQITRTFEDLPICPPLADDVTVTRASLPREKKPRP